ncbi:MAG: aminotransferase class V-fold PLP-dependent enzyme [Planctomycetes bacterium]|nr:aminotransferase class V-fold PLP-dependent enzyme [Planctomycetota bacterium]MCW8134756.1 aminotransferase class V-fold PLP-dependent enzyme [Planctomycetota bacterium]
MTNDPLLKWREEFPILSRKTYLINNSLGAMPRKVYEGLKHFADMWNEDGVVAWHYEDGTGWLDDCEKTADLIGSVMGAPPRSVMLHLNVATLTAQVLSSIDFSGKRNRIVYDDMQFTSPHYVCQQWARYGAELHLVKSHDRIGVDVQQLLDAIDERTAIVPISHVYFRSAYLQDVQPIIDKAHKVGAKVLLDVYQSIGTVPFDVTQLNVDFAVGGSVKWVCGGPNVCYLYIRPDLIPTYQPALTGWISHARPFKFEMDFTPHKTAWRAATGTPPVVALYSARPGYDIIKQVGLPAIREKSVRLTSHLVEKALEAGFTVNSPRDPARRGGTVCIDFANAEEAHNELIRRGFVIDYRPGGGIRVSPHFYNTIDECNAIIAQMKELRR